MRVIPFQVAQSKLDKVTAAANARQKATFNPEEGEDSTPTPVVQKVKRRVSIGVVVDAETGAIVESGKRHSQRRHTVLNTSISDLRLKDELEKKVRLPPSARSGTVLNS